MKLNCKPGEMAIKVKGSSTHEIPVGAVVTCLDYRTEPWIDDVTGEENTHGVWHVEFRGSDTCPVSNCWWVCEDEHLRPIRDTDGEDETLSWLPSPTKETV